MKFTLLVVLVAASLASAADLDPNDCPGYRATNIRSCSNVLRADLTLRDDACNIYGDDIGELKLLVEYQTENRLHVKIYDAEERAYQLQEDNLASPGFDNSTQDFDLDFSMIEEPFSFAVIRRSNGQVLFNTSGQAIVFETQYLRLRTSLPDKPNIYGLGENADPIRHDPNNYSHTFWNSGQGYVPSNANLYGSHPVYYDHRGVDGTHAVFFRSSTGMKVDLGGDSGTGNYLDWKTLGGVFDLYFISGPTPKEVSTQLADVIGYPALMPYWSFGYHQCKYGYQDIYETAGVIANYSAANIPLESIWNDIDYMDYRSVFSLDPLRYPLEKVRELVDYLHNHEQHYVMMVDGFVASRDYKPFHDGVAWDAFLKEQNGSLYTGVDWPGPANFPDWFAPGAQGFWTEQMTSFFNASSGVDIDGLWIDMNEVASFCTYPCSNPPLIAIEGPTVEGTDPPRPPAARMYSPYEIPGFPDDFQPHCMAVVTFNVDAATAERELLLILGNATALGDNAPYYAPALSGSSGNRTITVQLPVNSSISYSYPRYTKEGKYVLDPESRSVETGDCGWTLSVSEYLDTSINTTTIMTNLTNPRATTFSSQIQRLKTRNVPTYEPGAMQGFPGRDLLTPPYDIKTYYGSLIEQTLPTNLYHDNGLAELDVHNLFGSMMGSHSINTLLTRRPDKRPFMVTRSTFAGDGKRAAHWFGDNTSSDRDYRVSINQMIQFASMYQLPMVGTDVCGFMDPTNEILCSRWAVLGAWYPFFRNHADSLSPRQEFFLWPMVTKAARKAIETRYRLLDYMYTNLYIQNQTGMPMITPLLWQYPEDTNTYTIDLQFFHGEALLVSPVTEPNSTTVTFYMPNDLFYDFDTFEKVHGNGTNITREDVDYTEIPVYIRGGSILPMRAKGANTTTALRREDFHLIVAPATDGTASGTLYLDDGESLFPKTSLIQFRYEDGMLTMNGTFGYDPEVNITQITLLGVENSSCGKLSVRSLKKRYTLPLTTSFSINI